MLELSHKLGVNFGFTTNGLALTKQNVERIISYDPFNVNISIESVDAEVNDALRPFANGLKRVLAGVELLLEEKRRVGSRVFIKSLPSSKPFATRATQSSVMTKPSIIFSSICKTPRSRKALASLTWRAKSEIATSGSAPCSFTPTETLSFATS